jgi:hypothetical protein
VICPDNTIHQALPLIEARSPLPWLHIAQCGRRRSARPRFQEDRAYRHQVAGRQPGLSRRLPAALDGGARGDQPHHHGRVGARHLQARAGRHLPEGDRPAEGRRAATRWRSAAPRSR